MSVDEAKLLDHVLLTVFRDFGHVDFLEIGVAGGATMAGLFEKCDALGVKLRYEGVDCSESARPEALPAGAVFHCGDSLTIYPKVGWTEFNCVIGFNILLIDGNHSLKHVTADFENYSPKVFRGGFVIFHDTKDDPNWQGQHWQGIGEDIPENRIAVRWALKNLGLLDGSRPGWKLVQEIGGPMDCGMCLFQKL
jgi:hypothetical protein